MWQGCILKNNSECYNQYLFALKANESAADDVTHNQGFFSPDLVIFYVTKFETRRTFSMAIPAPL